MTGILVGCTKDSNEFREAYLVLVNIVRKVHILKEYVSDTTVALATPRRREGKKRLTAIQWGHRFLQE